jgi:hypothetical protein
VLPAVLLKSLSAVPGVVVNQLALPALVWHDHAMSS